MNEHDSANDERRGSTDRVHATPRATSVAGRLLQLSLADVMHFCLLFLLVVATARAVFVSDGHQTQSADASVPASLTIEQIAVEAKARMAEGVPADEVAAWVDQAKVSAGIVEAAPMLDTWMERNAALASRSASLDPAESPHRN